MGAVGIASVEGNFVVLRSFCLQQTSVDYDMGLDKCDVNPNSNFHGESWKIPPYELRA